MTLSFEEVQRVLWLVDAWDWVWQSMPAYIMVARLGLLTSRWLAGLHQTPCVLCRIVDADRVSPCGERESFTGLFSRLNPVSNMIRSFKFGPHFNLTGSLVAYLCIRCSWTAQFVHLVVPWPFELQWPLTSISCLTETQTAYIRNHSLRLRMSSIASGYHWGRLGYGSRLISWQGVVFPKFGM